MNRMFSLGLLGIWLAIAPASAQTVSVRVQTRYLDLTSAPGVRTLQRRITGAARRVCHAADDGLAFMVPGRNRCRQDAIARAEPQVRFAIAQARARSVMLASR